MCTTLGEPTVHVLVYENRDRSEILAVKTVHSSKKEMPKAGLFRSTRSRNRKIVGVLLLSFYLFSPFHYLYYVFSAPLSLLSSPVAVITVEVNLPAMRPAIRDVCSLPSTSTLS